MSKPGNIYLVGAGPGDPELLTIKAARLLDRADVVVYDRLVSEDILDLVNPFAERIYVGKSTGRHSLKQCEINTLLVHLAYSHQHIVRLKGGDPYIFGRGGEEAEHLSFHNIPFEVIPGITAAAGCMAKLNLPLTHRGLASGVRFVTGHMQADAVPSHDWRSLADPDTTLAIYMGVKTMPLIAGKLMEHGLSDQTPTMIIENGSTLEQRHLRTTLGRLCTDLERIQISPPCMIVIGRVISLADRLQPPLCDLIAVDRLDHPTPAHSDKGLHYAKTA
ncbi:MULTISPECIES: uroporphyrinogen-III C-methyltransferase [Thalassospira]|uniref:uroporphyrinogen-III C-methyltransferase n=2 Tax=Thalassospira TaxID=168934 RepID=A0A367W884_9PROT|nr:MULTISPECIES: uroporphyrinogen-III C-methyltransferase [Thalassospira]MDG4720433.1 uroporphyrinogen-III C-methyltransferase [Thalassospira sp. FZY0004]RCK37587.1 uroporphyrin-III methyltransferase [Thalassospira profundimaris]